MKDENKTTTGSESELSEVRFLDGKRRAYTTVCDDTGLWHWRLAIVTENEAGYHLTKDDSDAGGSFKYRSDADFVASCCNERAGLSPRDVGLIIASSLRNSP